MAASGRARAARPERRSPIAASLLLSAAVGVYAVSFGVLGVQAGLTVAQTCAMSLLVFTGASQFAAVGVVAAGGSPLAAVSSALLLGARNAVYGLAMARELPPGKLRRLLAAHFVIDESTAMALAQDEPVGALVLSPVLPAGASVLRRSSPTGATGSPENGRPRVV